MNSLSLRTEQFRQTAGGGGGGVAAVLRAEDALLRVATEVESEG